MKSTNKMYILLNSIMCQLISLPDCKNEKSLSKNGAQSPKKLDMHDLARLMRSEEHTSELQSRETISYAVFCLKKKRKKIGHFKMT